ncbi:MAG: NTP transferase domain-containing protein [Candidatus Zixiibacteriota bacterium]|nr:MAG: NTP transferase domain-containing protein [candidate division Zixibacteria bacterium]
MKAIIMAGGFGTRLRPLTINIPKPMVPIADVPIMEHVVNLLRKHSITEITSLLYFQPETIKDYFKDGTAFGVHMDYVKPDDDYGTAGAVRYALDNVTEPVLIISGDLITDFNLSEAIEWHLQKKSQATILLTRMENPLAYGIVITDQEGRIVRFLEKPSWGEAFSDTINTGIYILEPEAAKLIPPKTNFDFSQNLYPLMLSRQMGLHGKVMTGYWKDVGNVDEYQNVHVDFFDKKLNLDLKGDVKATSAAVVYTGTNVQLGGDIEFTGRVVLGDDVAVDDGARLHNCVVGSRSRVESGSELNNTVVWSDNHIGRDAVINSTIVCNRVRIGNYVQLLDKVIVSDDCTIGDSATVKANCKIWPGKTVDDGAIVSTSLVWGEKWNRELFTNAKVTGLALTEITPEMALKVGAAFGAYVGRTSAVVLSRDASDTSRLIKRGLTSGLLAAGTNVADLETLPVPIVRYWLQKGNYAAGIYVRHNPDDFRQIDLIFFDGSGLDLPTAKSKKVERMYFGEDFERASLDNIGHLDMPQHVLDDYRKDFMANVDSDIINQAGFKIVIDHSNGSSSQVFPTLFSLLGISATELNASLNPRKFSTSPEENAQAIVQMSSIVSSLKADIGFIINPAAEKLVVVDESGQPIDSHLLLLLVIDLYLQTHESKKIAVPVAASMGAEEIAGQHGVEVVRVANDHLSMMEIFRRGEVDFVGGTRGGFIFPGFQMGSDAVLTTVKILEMMAQTRSRLGSLSQKFTKLSRVSVSVPCPWSKKGTVMRQLIINSEDKNRQLIDGVRIFEDNGWVLVTPDRMTASFIVFAESDSQENASQLADRYRNFVEQYQLS